MRESNDRQSRRAELRPIICRLRDDDGLTWREIGERLGIARQTAHDYYSDPDGVAYAVRHARYRAKDFVECPRCGGLLHGSASRRGAETCRKCRDEIGRQATNLRVEDVAEMFREGLSYREIAEALGYGPNSSPPEIIEARRRGLIGYRYTGCEKRAAA